MVYEHFIEHEVKKGKNTSDWRLRLLMQIGRAAINPDYQKDKWFEDIRIPCDFIENWDFIWFIWRLHDKLQKIWEPSRLQEYMEILMERAKKEKAAPEVLEILPFAAYYETCWNGRKGYGELVEQARELQMYCSPKKPISQYHVKLLGEYMAAMVDCYELMSEEAYEQREVFAQYLRTGAREYKNFWKEKPSVTSEHLLISYTLLKGIRLHILIHEEYGFIARTILLAWEAIGFLYIKNELEMKGNGNKEKAALSCMLAYGEYNRLKKERPYYGI